MTRLETIIQEALRHPDEPYLDDDEDWSYHARVAVRACRVALCTDPTLATELGAEQGGWKGEFDDVHPFDQRGWAWWSNFWKPLYYWPVVSPETETTP